MTAFTATTVTLQGNHGTAVTYDLASSTQFREGNLTVTSAALALGERVNVRLDPTTSPSTVVAMEIHLSHFEGQVAAVSGTSDAGSITLLGHAQTTQTVLITSSTTFVMQGQPATFANVTVGSEVGAQGIETAANTLTASSVRITAPEVTPPTLAPVVGTVTAFTAKSITIQPATGLPQTFRLLAVTIFDQGSTAVSSSALKVGETVTVTLHNSSMAALVDIS